MSILVDTNVLLRRTQLTHPDFAIAVSSVAALLTSGETAYYTLQNISEFWNVATRTSEQNGLGFSVELALREVEKLETSLELLPDVTGMYLEWRRLVVKHRVLGSKVHDAKLVAATNVHGVRRVLTFNLDDFRRYDIEAIHPASVGPL